MANDPVVSTRKRMDRRKTYPAATLVANASVCFASKVAGTCAAFACHNGMMR
jgi:hypothetical protein